jgi:hypothetical protein
MATRLVTTRYTAPGVYIGQLIRPGPGNLNADARICNYIGQGSKLAVGSNLGIRRSFVFDEELNLATTAPYEALLSYPADGSRDAPTRIFDSVTGVELRSDQWIFKKVGSDFVKIEISASTYNPLAVYKIDYQSTSRNVNDPLPLADLRVIKSLGTVQGKAQYKDLKDFFIPFSFYGPSSESTNATASSFLTSVFPDFSNVGGGSASIDTAASYNHNYNRFYELEVTAISGVSGAFTATFEWSAERYSGGSESLPPTPLHSSAPRPSFVAQEAVTTSLIAELELGIKVDIAFSGTNFSVGDKFYFNGVGPGLIEWDSRYFNANQYLDFGGIDSTTSGTGLLSYASSNNYTGTYNCKFKLEVVSSGGIVGSRTATFVWAQYGDLIGPSSTSVVNEGTSLDLSLTQGVTLTIDFGSANFNVGDSFEFVVNAPRIFYEAKDDRVYKLTISAATNPGADVGYVAGAYATGTSSGGFGSWEANVNLLSGASQETGFFLLPDNIRLAVRNAMRGNINGSSFSTGDIFNASSTSQNVIDWSLTTKVEEIRETSAFLTDVTGAITGTAGTTYIILDNIYESGTVTIVDQDTSAPISIIELPNTRFVAFITTPTASVVVNYLYKGQEPSPSQLYYLTANYLRPTTVYNTPTMILDRNDGRLFLGPAETENHLYIMNELVFDNNAPGAYYTQSFDADGDGVLIKTDILESLLAHETLNRPTDLCVLSQFESLSDSLAMNEKCNDPFEKKEQMLWVGAPIGTPIGDIDTPDSLIYLARSSLQVPPQSVSQGTRVLVAPTEASKTIVLENGISQTVTLDGSFVAGATSALVNSFTDPAKTILRQNLAGFDSIQVYSEPENLMLGNASITWMTQRGDGIYRFEEDITVHTMSEEFQLISATTQKQFVTKLIRREMDANLISIVVPNAAAAIAIIRSQLSELLLGLLGQGKIADYQDENGNPRSFDAGKDVVVLRDTATLTKYDFFYSYYIKAPIKRLFGLYAVNTNDFGLK